MQAETREQIMERLAEPRRAAEAVARITLARAVTAAQAAPRAAAEAVAVLAVMITTAATVRQAATHKSKYGYSDEMARTQR